MSNIPADLESLSESKLREIAGERDIEGRSSMSKRELIRAIEKSVRENPPTI